MTRPYSRSSHSRIVAAIAVAALTTTACGTTDSPSASPATTAMSAPAETTPPTPPPSASTSPAPTVVAEPPPSPTPPADEVPGLHQLIAGHNGDPATRINLVFAGHSFTPDTDPQAFAHDLLTWDGPTPVDFAGQPIADPTDPNFADLSYGPFAIEPFRSNKDLFNLWYYPQPAAGPSS